MYIHHFFTDTYLTCDYIVLFTNLYLSTENLRLLFINALQAEDDDGSVDNDEDHGWYHEPHYHAFLDRHPAVMLRLVVFHGQGVVELKKDKKGLLSHLPV